MNDVRMIISDLDFTLLNCQFALSEETKRVLTQVIAKGIAFIPCSSRAMSDIPQWFLEQKEIPYIVASNGALIMRNHDGKLCVKHTLALSQVKKILAAVNRINPYWSCSINGKLHSHLRIIDDREALDIRGSYLENVLKTRILERDPSFLDAYSEEDTIEKLHFIINPEQPQEKQALLDQLAAEFPDLHISSSHPKNIEITHPQATKGAALRWLMEQLNCAKEQVMACGDNENDISMLELAEYRISVANATQQVKNIANYHGEDHDKEGCAKMIASLVLEDDLV